MDKTLEEIRLEDLKTFGLTGHMKKDKFIPDVNAYNIIKLFEGVQSLTDKVRYNTWTQTQEFFDEETKKYVPYKDKHDVLIMADLQKNFWFLSKVPKNIVKDAIEAIAQNNTVDTAKEYLATIPKWDKKERLKRFCADVWGTEDDSFHEIIGMNFWKQMVARMTRPGCKVDNVLVVEGRQGVGKSSVWDAICGQHMNGDKLEYYLGYTSITDTNFDDVNFIIKTQGSLIVEFAEGTTLKRAREMEAMKAYISLTTDRATEKFKNYMKEYPRRFVLTMATNEDTFLKDSTGNRRFIPIEAHGVPVNGSVFCDVDKVFMHRDQLFAEALYRLDHGETYHEYPQDQLDAIHQVKLIKSPYFDVIREWTDDPTDAPPPIDNNGGFTTMDIWNICLNGQTTALIKMKEMEISGVLISLGFERTRNRIDGKRKYRWYRTTEQMNIDEKIDDDLANVDF